MNKSQFLTKYFSKNRHNLKTLRLV